MPQRYWLLLGWASTVYKQSHRARLKTSAPSPDESRSILFYNRHFTVDMVATRRAAQPIVDDELAMDDPELALKKKPVRKATAKTTKTAAKTAERPKTTRSKKAEPEPEIQDEVEEDVQPVKPTRKAAGRPKKEAVPESPVEDATMSKKPTRGAKAGSVRGKKAIPVAEDIEPAPVAEEPKPTRATRHKQKSNRRLFSGGKSLKSVVVVGLDRRCPSLGFKAIRIAECWDASFRVVSGRQW